MNVIPHYSVINGPSPVDYHDNPLDRGGSSRSQGRLPVGFDPVTIEIPASRELFNARDSVGGKQPLGAQDRVMYPGRA